MQRVVEWIDTAYEFVQNLHDGRWQFLQTEFTFPTIAGTTNYTKASVSPALTELASWKTDTFRAYLTANGINDQQELEYIRWDDFRFVYGRGSQSTLTGRPILFTVKPDYSISFWPIPSDVYTVSGEYFKRPQVMTADTDVPLIPQQFQSVIVWKGLMYYGAYAGADEKYSHGQNEYRAAVARLVKNQMNRVVYGSPLA